jgi:hypothetical protein
MSESFDQQLARLRRLSQWRPRTIGPREGHTFDVCIASDDVAALAELLRRWDALPNKGRCTCFLTQATRDVLLEWQNTSDRDDQP